MTAAALLLLIAVAPGLVLVGAVAFFFAGVVWNTRSIFCRKRIAPNAIRGWANSVHRFFAEGMMLFGLLAPGLIVRYAKDMVDRSAALTAPFSVAGLGILVRVALLRRLLARIGKTLPLAAVW